MRKKTNIHFLLLTAFLAGCADLVALPFGVMDTAVWVGTLGNVNMRTSNAVRGAVNEVTGENERRDRRREARAARREAAIMEAKQEEDSKIELAVYRQIALTKDPDYFLKCENDCNQVASDTIPSARYWVWSNCVHRCGTRIGNPTDEEFRKYKAEYEAKIKKSN